MKRPEDSRQVPARELTVARRAQIHVDDGHGEVPVLDLADRLQVLGRRLDDQAAGPE